MGKEFSMILWYYVLKVELDSATIYIVNCNVSFMLDVLKAIRIVLRTAVLQSGCGEKELLEKLV